jgi:hypothetical protein
MNKEYLKEKLAVFKMFLPLFWTSLFVLTGGLIHFHNDLGTYFKKFIWFSGCFLFFCLVFVNLIIFVEIKRFLKKIKESDNV